MSFDSDLLDDIFSQPSNIPERALGRFLPKARRKNEKVVQQPISSDHPVQDGERVSTMLAPKVSAEGFMDKPGSSLCEPNSSDSLQRDHGSSVEQTELILPESDSLDDILPELVTTTERVRGKVQPEVRTSASKFVFSSLCSTSACKSLSSGLNRHGSFSPFEEEAFRNSEPEGPASNGLKDLQTDSGKSEEKETRVFTSLESLEDGCFQASEASEVPLLGAAASGINGHLQTDDGPSGGEKISAPFDMGSVDNDFSQPDVTPYSEAIIPDHSDDMEVQGRLQAEEESELYEDNLSQPTLSAARGVGKFQPKLGAKLKKAKAMASDCFDAMEPVRSSDAISPEIEAHGSPVLGFPPDSSVSLEHPASDMLGENEKASDMAAASPDNHKKLDHLEKYRLNNRKRKLPSRGGSTAEDFEVSDGKQSSRQLRKRTPIGTVVNEPEDENEEDLEVGVDKLSDSQMDEESSDDEYTGSRSSKKRIPRKSRGPQDEMEKPTRRHKKASFGSDSSTQEPQMKKFPHSTRRSSRKVDKVLLETPEEDIDPMRLRIKDLIMLAEARERTSVKEAATKRQSTQDQSDSSFFNNASFGNDNQEQDLNVDGDDQTVHFSTTKLNYHTYMSRTRAGRWSKVDTELFYQAVRQFGSDFAMIQQLFPNRTRHHIKLKFKSEERKHPLQIADALIHRSKDNSHFELVIQRLQAQEEENANADAADDEPRDESQTKTSENEEEDHVEADKKEEEEVDDWDQGHDSANGNEYQDVFDWSQYEFQNSSSPYDKEKDEYNIF